ncbi:hypothetical protein [[Mycobacterium] wendilense]|uniref:Uncharacterized protein n=1 Tax=[Mycobacterium] wendilense TaxID=3064284 RepID=A0ABM9MIP8_9MYCO|nr:hypothetical protein [Mycolicibacterium sp. MU0050]CAJ1586160.1 hypothetical protein MU0050_004121 [Mycolicibacterium sp. MU0050]
MTTNWRGPVHQLLYGLMYTGDVTDDIARSHAEDAVSYRTLPMGPQVYYDAIMQALASGQELDEARQLRHLDADDIERFLRGVVVELDALRPWPEPPFRVLTRDTWEGLASTPPAARLNDPVGRVGRFLKKSFRPAGKGYPGKAVLVLKLSTGETVALIGSFAGRDAVALHTDAHDPAAAITHFVEQTGYPESKIERI